MTSSAWAARAADLKQKLMANRQALTLSNDPVIAADQFLANIENDIVHDSSTNKTNIKTNSFPPSSDIQSPWHSIKPPNTPPAGSMADVTRLRDGESINAMSNIQQEGKVQSALPTTDKIPPSVDLQFVFTSDLKKALKKEQQFVKALQDPATDGLGIDNVQERIHQSHNTILKLQRALQAREATGIASAGPYAHSGADTTELPDKASNSLTPKTPANKPTMGGSSETSCVAMGSPKAKLKADVPTPINSDNTITRTAGPPSSAVIQADAHIQSNLQKHRNTNTDRLPTKTVADPTGPTTPMSKIPLPVSTASRPEVTSTEKAPGQSRSDKPMKQPPTTPSPRRAKGILRDAAAHGSASPPARWPLVASSSDRECGRECDRPARPKSNSQSRSPNESRTKIGTARRERNRDHTYIFRSVGAGAGDDSGNRARQPSRRPSASRKHSDIFPRVADTYRPPRADRMSNEDRDLHDWLTYTNWYDRAYRARFLERMRRLAEIEREKAALLEANQHENTATATTTTRGRPTTDAGRMAPPPAAEPFGFGLSRQRLGGGGEDDRPGYHRAAAGGFKRELGHADESGAPRKVSRIDDRGPGRVAYHDSPPPWPRRGRLSEDFRRIGESGEGENPSTQPGEQSVPWMRQGSVVTILTPVVRGSHPDRASSSCCPSPGSRSSPPRFEADRHRRSGPGPGDVSRRLDSAPSFPPGQRGHDRHR